MEEKAHAKFSPSTMGMLERCPGFRNTNKKNALSERGDRIHDALENETIDLLPEEERAIAQPCKDYIESTLASYLPKEPDLDTRECRIEIDLGAGVTTFGTFDRLLIYGTKGHMYDFKSGYREVTDAENNAQGWSYVIGIFQKYPKLESCEVTFLIPNRDEVSSHTFKRSDVPDLKLRINTIIQRAAELEDPEFFFTHPERLNPLPELCEYCSRQTTCPALMAKHLKVLQTVGGGLPVPSDLRVDKTRPEDIAHLLRLAPLMAEWAEQIRKDALRINLEEGVDIPGYNRFERSLPRTASSVLGAWEVIQEKFQDAITLEDFLAHCGSVSIPKLEDLVAEKAKHKEKGKARELFNEELRGADVLQDRGKIFYLREEKK